MRDIPSATVARLSIYLRALHAAAAAGTTRISSDQLATASGVRPTQLRKDLSHLGSHGIRGVGYDVGRLTAELTTALGLNHTWPVAIVGMGNVGRALVAYSGFATEGFDIVAVLDRDPQVIGETLGALTITDIAELAAVVDDLGVQIGVIATPASSAQDVADQLVDAGVGAVLSFAPAAITVPDGVSLRRVDLAADLHVLAFLRRSATLDPAEESLAGGVGRAG